MSLGRKWATGMGRFCSKLAQGPPSARLRCARDTKEALASGKGNVYTGIFPGLNLGERVNAPKR
jgi:hypothetical protein